MELILGEEDGQIWGIVRPVQIWGREEALQV